VRRERPHAVGGAHRVEEAPGFRGDTLAAHLVPGKPGGVEEEDVALAPGQESGQRRARRAAGDTTSNVPALTRASPGRANGRDRGGSEERAPDEAPLKPAASKACAVVLAKKRRIEKVSTLTGLRKAGENGAAKR
jgi:hypothetical protein